MCHDLTAFPASDWHSYQLLSVRVTDISSFTTATATLTTTTVTTVTAIITTATTTITIITSIVEVCMHDIAHLQTSEDKFWS